MEKTYGALVADAGRAAAERFFPRAARKAAVEPSACKTELKPEWRFHPCPAPRTALGDVRSNLFRAPEQHCRHPVDVPRTSKHLQ